MPGPRETLLDIGRNDVVNGAVFCPLRRRRRLLILTALGRA